MLEITAIQLVKSCVAVSFSLPSHTPETMPRNHPILDEQKYLYSTGTSIYLLRAEASNLLPVSFLIVKKVRIIILL